jgi:hypothetical protein
MAEKNYEYGLTEEDTRPGLSWSQPANLFYPYRREVIKAPVEERTRVDDRYVPSFTPGEYGEKEFGLKHMPFVRGIGSLYDFAGKFFSNPEVREKALTSVGKGIATLFEDQYLAAINAGRGGDLQYYDPKKGRVVNWDPLFVTGSSAVLGKAFPVTGRGTTLGMFAGVNARTADLKNLEKAKKMASKGRSREEIWDETGWFRWEDGKGNPVSDWRFEISDASSEAFFNEKVLTPTGRIGTGKKHLSNPRVSDIFRHPEAYEAYPGGAPSGLETVKEITRQRAAIKAELEALKRSNKSVNSAAFAAEYQKLQDKSNALLDAWAKGVQHGPRKADRALVDVGLTKFDPRYRRTAGAYYQPWDDKMAFQTLPQKGIFDPRFATGERWPDSWVGKDGVTYYKKDYAPLRRFRSSALHEQQHAIQHREKWEPGGSQREFGKKSGIVVKDPETGAKLSAVEIYMRLLGEAEARLVESRRDLTMAERREKPPWTMLDRPEEKLILRKDIGGDPYNPEGPGVGHNRPPSPIDNKAAGGFIDKPLYDDQRMIG